MLQPMNSQDFLRKTLSENGFEVTEEDIETEDIYVYNLIIARAGQGVVYKDEFDLQIPSYLYSHKNFAALKEKKLREFNKIKSGLTKAAVKDYPQIEKYTNFIERLNKEGVEI